MNRLVRDISAWNLSRKMRRNHGRKRKSLVILLDSNTIDLIENFRRLGEDLEEGLWETSMIYCGEQDQHQESDLFCFSLKDVSWNGRIKNKPVADSLNIGYEILIAFTSGENKSAGFLVSAMRADLKLGINERVFRNDLDLTIAVPVGEPETFLHETRKYLKKIRSI